MLPASPSSRHLARRLRDGSQRSSVHLWTDGSPVLRSGTWATIGDRSISSETRAYWLANSLDGMGIGKALGGSKIPPTGYCWKWPETPGSPRAHWLRMQEGTGPSVHCCRPNPRSRPCVVEPL